MVFENVFEQNKKPYTRYSPPAPAALPGVVVLPGTPGTSWPQSSLTNPTLAVGQTSGSSTTSGSGGGGAAPPPGSFETITSQTETQDITLQQKYDPNAFVPGQISPNAYISETGDRPYFINQNWYYPQKWLRENKAVIMEVQGQKNIFIPQGQGAGYKTPGLLNPGEYGPVYALAGSSVVEQKITTTSFSPGTPEKYIAGTMSPASMELKSGVKESLFPKKQSLYQPVSTIGAWKTQTLSNADFIVDWASNVPYLSPWLSAGAGAVKGGTMAVVAVSQPFKTIKEFYG